MSYADFKESHQVGLNYKNALKMPDQVVPGFGDQPVPEVSEDELGKGGQVDHEGVKAIRESSKKRGHFKVDKDLLDQKIDQPKVSQMEEEVTQHSCEEGDDKVVNRVCHRHRFVKLKITPASSYQKDFGCPGHKRGGGWRKWIEYDACGVRSVHVPKKVEVIEEGWNDDCGEIQNLQDQGLCSLQQAQKLEENVTKTIDGEPIQRSHWIEKYDYTCRQPSVNNCNILREKGCTQTGSKCVQYQKDRCIRWRQTFECRKRANKINLAPQKGTIHCLKGDCFDQSYTPNHQMMNALSHMSILKAVQDDIQKEGIVFKGSGAQCSRNWLGWKDCCQVEREGWGQSMKLAECSGEEKKLAHERGRGVCVLVGTYESKHFIGTSVTKKTSFCCFGTKLSKLVQEQGRAQLGLGFGTPESPDCRGLTPTELSKLDFSKMDLSPLFKDVADKFKPEDISKTKSRIDAKLQSMTDKIQNKSEAA